MSRRAIAVCCALPLALSGWGLDAAAQEPNRAGCHAVLLEFEPALASGAEAVACQVLAGELLGALTDQLWPGGPAAAVRDGDVQPTSAGSSTAAGSPAQSEAVASGQPLGVGGGSISLVGSEGGTDGITSLTFNPWVFFGGDREHVARYSRFSDLTVFFPMNDIDGDEDGEVDYFGARLRVNVTGLSAGDAVWDEVTTSFESLLADEFQVLSTLRSRLGGMPEEEMRACVGAIRSAAGAPAVEARCGAGLDAPPEAEYRAFQAALDRARVKADAKYFGLDLRVESGDPTLGAVESAALTSLNVGLALGRQFVGDAPDPLAPSAGFRLRAGVRYADLHEVDETSFAFEGAAAFVMKRPVAIDQALTFSGGLEMRAGDAEGVMEGQFQADYLSLRASLHVPVTRQTAISIAFGHPVWGDEVSSALSITGDWRLGLQELTPGGGP